MSRGRIIRKFERMLNSNNSSEVGPDSIGALKEDVEKSERINSKENYDKNYLEKNKPIGQFIYDFNTEKTSYESFSD